MPSRSLVAAMITGSHIIIYSTDPPADRAFLRDVLHFPHVDAGEGWLIFALPPAELALHPSSQNGPHELFLICDDIHAFVEEMAQNSVPCSPVERQRWGLVTYLTLPGGGQIGVYQPSHLRPAASDVSERKPK